jgi:hypothetical protein
MNNSSYQRWVQVLQSIFRSSYTHVDKFSILHPHFRGITADDLYRHVSEDEVMNAMAGIQEDKLLMIVFIRTLKQRGYLNRASTPCDSDSD